MTQTEALKLALEALEIYKKDYGSDPADDEAITAIREALAQPEQEPWPEEPEGHIAGGVHPPQRTWVGLTDEEIWTVLQFRGYNTDTIEIARSIEAKLKEKNT